jgi:hypothetical protein
VNPYRLVALAVIAMFALGYARLLIDTGIKEEDERAVPADLITKAACTAIAGPLAEALEISWEPEMETSGDQSVCVLASDLPADSDSDVVLSTAGAVFQLLRWERVDSDVDTSRAYMREPVVCILRVDNQIRAVCAR